MGKKNKSHHGGGGGGGGGGVGSATAGSGLAGVASSAQQQQQQQQQRQGSSSGATTTTTSTLAASISPSVTTSSPATPTTTAIASPISGGGGGQRLKTRGELLAEEGEGHGQMVGEEDDSQHWARSRSEEEMMQEGTLSEALLGTVLFLLLLPWRSLKRMNKIWELHTGLGMMEPWEAVGGGGVGREASLPAVASRHPF